MKFATQVGRGVTPKRIKDVGNKQLCKMFLLALKKVAMCSTIHSGQGLKIAITMLLVL